MRTPQNWGPQIETKNRFEVLGILDFCSALTDVDGPIEKLEERTVEAKHLTDNVQTTEAIYRINSQLGQECPTGTETKKVQKYLRHPLTPCQNREGGEETEHKFKFKDSPDEGGYCTLTRSLGAPKTETHQILRYDLDKASEVKFWSLSLRKKGNTYDENTSINKALGPEPEQGNSRNRMEESPNLENTGQISAPAEQICNDSFYDLSSCQSTRHSTSTISSLTQSSSEQSLKETITPFRNMIIRPPEKCDCKDPKWIIGALGEKERRSLQRFSFFQFFTLQNWVNFGNQKFMEVINKENASINMIKESKDADLPGFHTIGTFIENRSAMILPIMLEGMEVLATIDTGAAITISSDSFFALNINPFFHQTLEMYTGPKLHSCQNKHLKVLGVYSAQFQLGSLNVKHPIVIYESSLKEILIGFDFVSKYDLVISKKGLFAPDNLNPEGICRVGEASIPYFTMYSKHHSIVQPYSGEILKVFLDASLFKEKISTMNAKKVLWVAHSEDHEYCEQQEDLSIFYQVVTMEDCETHIYFHNNTDFPINIAENEELGAIEQMTQISLKNIHAQEDSKVLQIFRSMIDIPRHRQLHERESDIFCDIPCEAPKAIEWDQLDCPPIAGLKDKLIKLCKKYQNIYGIDKYDINSINMGSSKYVRLSINTGTSPVNQMAIPTHPSLIPAAKKFLQTLLDRNLIGLAPQKCAWSSSLFFVRKHSDTNIVEGRDLQPNIDPMTRVAESASARNGQKNDPIAPELAKPDHFSKKVPKCPKMGKNGPNYIKSDKNGKFTKTHFKAPKPDISNVRAITDLRGVNSKLKTNSLSAWPILPCRDIINQLQTKTFVSQVDCLIAYWQVPLSPKKGQNILAFNFQGCHFVPKKLQHGLNCAMSIFTRIISKILIKAKLDPFVTPFCDNLVIATETLEHHLVVLEKLFQTLDNANIKIHYKKQNLCHNKSIKLFGYILDLEKKFLSPDRAKLNEIARLPIPKTKKQCRRYTGMFAMWSTIIPNLAQILSPIYANCSEKATFKWGPEQEKSWQDSKNLLIKHFYVALPDFSKQFIIVTDAARKLGCSHTVFQRDKNGTLCPISHHSKIFKGSEIFFSQAKAEMFSLVIGLNMNIMYFSIAGPQRHLALTDAICLQWAAKYCYQNAQLYNWSSFIFSLPIKVLALAQNSPLIVWSDMWSRPLNVKKTIEKVYNDKNFDPQKLLTLDFSGLPPLNIEDIFKICTKFNTILEKHGDKKVHEGYNNNKENLNFPDKPTQVLRIAVGKAILLNQENPEKGEFFSTGIYRTLAKVKKQKAHTLCNPGDRQIFDIKRILETHLPNISWEYLSKLQGDDILCRKLKVKVDLCSTKEGLLFKHRGNIAKLIIPKTLSYSLLWSLHNFNSIYHISYKKLKTFTDKYFVIQDFSATLHKIVANCENCLLNVKAPWPRENILGPTILVSKPFLCLHFDFLVINSTFKRYPSLLSVTDIFSNASWFFACNHNITGEEFVNMFLTNIAHITGIPAMINSDGQAAYISDKLATFCSVFRIKHFISTRAASNRSEAKNSIALKMARAICLRSPLQENLMPALGTLLSLTYNELPLAINKCSPIDIIHNFGFNRPRLQKLNFLGLPKVETMGNYQARLAHLKEIMLQIKNRMFQKLKNTQRISHSLKKGDFCLIARKSKGHSPGAKLKTFYFKKPFRIYQIKSKSAVVIPFTPIKIVPSVHFRKGKRPARPKKLIVPLERIKKILNPFAILDLPITESQIDHFAIFLQKNASKKHIDRVQVVNPSHNLDPKTKKIRDFLCLPLNPGINLKFHQKNEALHQMEKFQKLKKVTKSNDFNTLFSNGNVFKVSDGTYLYELVSSINSSDSFQPSSSGSKIAKNKDEIRQEKFFRTPKTPTVPSKMFRETSFSQKNHPKVKKPPKINQDFFQWLKNQPDITHLEDKRRKPGSSTSSNSTLQGKKLNDKSIVEGISMILGNIEAENRLQDSENHDHEFHHDHDNQHSDDQGKVQSNDYATSGDDEDENGNDDDDNDDDSGDDDADDQNGGHGDTLSQGARPRVKSTTTPAIVGSHRNLNLSEKINVLDSESESLLDTSKKSVSFKTVPTVRQLKSGNTRNTTVKHKIGKPNRSNFQLLSKQASTSKTGITKPKQTKTSVSEKEKSKTSTMQRPQLVIGNPDFLISEEILKSSGTPFHLPARLPSGKVAPSKTRTQTKSRNTNKN